MRDFVVSTTSTIDAKCFKSQLQFRDLTSENFGFCAGYGETLAQLCCERFRYRKLFPQGVVFLLEMIGCDLPLGGFNI